MASKFEYYNGSEDDYRFISSTAPYLAQTFTIGTVGVNLDFDLTSVSVRFAAKDEVEAITANTSVYIYETDPAGIPIGSAISSGTVTAAQINALYGDLTGTYISVAMTSVTLKTSTTYAIVLDGSLVTTDREPGITVDNTAPGYTGGQIFTSTDGTTWTAQTEDFSGFAVYGGDYNGTLCTLSEATNKAGANASTNGKNEALVSNFVKHAEGVICSVTRYDWVDAYSGLSDDVKYILNQVASDMAATYIITYDMSGYTAATGEAETMINIYRETIARGLSLLRDQKVKTFIDDA